MIQPHMGYIDLIYSYITVHIYIYVYMYTILYNMPTVREQMISTGNIP